MFLRRIRSGNVPGVYCGNPAEVDYLPGVPSTNHSAVSSENVPGVPSRSPPGVPYRNVIGVFFFGQASKSSF